MRHIAANVISLLIVAGIAVAGVIAFGKAAFRAPGERADAVIVSVPQGASLSTTTDLLHEAGVIDHPMVFRLATRFARRDADIKFGEYEIPPDASMEDVLGVITSGRSIQYKVTVPEGLTSHEVVALLGAQDILTGDLPEVPPEGAIAPDTHFVAREADRDAVLSRMISAQDDILAKAWENRAEGLPLDTPEEMLILASIVQAEAGAGELSKVASVFVNRLERGQKLEADATVRYGITLGQSKLGRGLRRSELDTPTPYNTYTIPGLPPTPIGNPGRAAIEAVANPDETEYLFFVADGTGGHAFAETYDEHLKNVAAWRAIERARQSQ